MRDRKEQHFAEIFKNLDRYRSKNNFVGPSNVNGNVNA